MRISDWSSDVCSSDLSSATTSAVGGGHERAGTGGEGRAGHRTRGCGTRRRAAQSRRVPARGRKAIRHAPPTAHAREHRWYGGLGDRGGAALEVGIAPWREGVGQYVYVRGGAVGCKQKK